MSEQTNNKEQLNVLIDKRSLALLSPQHPSENRIPAEQKQQKHFSPN